MVSMDYILSSSSDFATLILLLSGFFMLLLIHWSKNTLKRKLCYPQIINESTESQRYKFAS